MTHSSLVDIHRFTIDPHRLLQYRSIFLERQHLKGVV